MEGARKLRSSMQFMRERKTWLTKLALRAPSCPRFSKTVKRNAPLNSCLCFGSHSLQTGFTWQAQFFCFTNGKKNEPVKTLWKRLLRFVFNHLAEGCKVLALKKKNQKQSHARWYSELQVSWSKLTGQQHGPQVKMPSLLEDLENTLFTWFQDMRSLNNSVRKKALELAVSLGKRDFQAILSWLTPCPLSLLHVRSDTRTYRVRTGMCRYMILLIKNYQ